MHTPQASTVSTSLAVGTSASEEMLCARVTNTIVLPDGALITENEANRPMVNSGWVKHGCATLGDTLSLAGWSHRRTSGQGESCYTGNE